MTYRTRLEGDCDALTTPGDANVHKLKDLVHGIWADDVYCDSISFLNGNATGGANLWVGVNGKATYVLAPGADVTFTKVKPGNCGVLDKGTAGTLIYAFGGEPASV